MSEHIVSATDTLSRAKDVRTEVLGPERCTLITPDHPLPTISRQSGTAEPRFELFHFVFSVCSQKVRGTLAEKAITYGSNEVGILPPHNDNYSPQYVRLRLMADVATKSKRVSTFTGRSSVESEGFDPLVVPTFVDHERSLVLADSKAICLHICATETTGTDLIPRGLEEQIASQLAIVDSTPHVALLYGADPDGDRRPASVRTKMPGIHKHKIEAVQRYMQLAGGDAELLAAYRQKIAKEQAAAGFVNINCAIEGVYPPSRTWEQDGPRLSSERAGRLMGEFPAALLPQAIMEGQIKALIVVGANPAVSISDPKKTRAALEHLDLLVTVDPRMTETSELSDYVIAPALPYEKPDVAALTESWGIVPIMQYTPPVLEMPTGVIEDWEFVWGLAKRLGVQLTLKVGPYGAEYASIPGGLKVDMQNKPNVDDFFSWAYRNAPITYADLKRHAGAISPDVAPTIVRAADTQNTARLDLMPADVAQELQDYREKAGEAGYDYLLCSRRLLEIMNSSFRLNERVRSRYKANRLFMNPDDIAAAGLRDGQGAEIQSKHGKVMGYIAQDRTLRRGVVSMTHHWAAVEGSRDGHSANLISIDPRDLSAISYMPHQSAIPVNVMPMPGGLQTSDFSP